MFVFPRLSEGPRTEGATPRTPRLSTGTTPTHATVMAAVGARATVRWHVPSQRATGARGLLANPRQRAPVPHRRGQVTRQQSPPATSELQRGLYRRGLLGPSAAPDGEKNT